MKDLFPRTGADEAASDWELLLAFGYHYVMADTVSSPRLLSFFFFFSCSAIINKVCRLHGSQDSSAQLGVLMQRRVAGAIISRPSSILAGVTESTWRPLNQFAIYRGKRRLPGTIELHFQPLSQCLMHSDVQDRRQVGRKPKNVKINEGFFSFVIF